MHAIVMAGGMGRRLAAVAPRIPKPLIEVGGNPIIEIIVRQLRASGFDRLTICVSHLGAQIEQALGDGRRFGVSIAYNWDRTPLGTAGPLRTVAGFDAPALVMNADILTTAELDRLVAAHRHGGAVLTVAVRECPVPVAFGVLRTDAAGRVTAVEEKPTVTVDVAAGMYVVDPSVVGQLPPDRPLDMPELITRLVDAGRPVATHRFADTWHDVGTPESLARAELDFLDDPGRFLAEPLIGEPR
ncbi:sugar phosphate nucleotidyltransferase [Dactylosporangium sp. AC04546]|uniref:sugar phosphate nucleotidyltransferase n=1 Tax=unclassified Dactylosporangium TaxID=2621675 RepID=UPI001EDF333A|nr:sugar phosphate nucleotidyltransferase [Dactylosporangium sp. AC04546]WVK81308.1 sugar phosphate nucleotidyltransferase [Dactylosporangium sp. AC04546]